MKACGRRLKTTMEKCGVLFEGSGAYCRDCRNNYQREYYAKKKEPLYKPHTEKTGASCQACATALRSNTVAIVERPEGTVVLCETCKAVVTYLSSTVDEAAMEFLMDLAVEIGLPNEDGSSSRPAPTTNTIQPYTPQILAPGNVEECIACETPARSGMATCEYHNDMEEAYQNSNAAKMVRGEL